MAALMGGLQELYYITYSARTRYSVYVSDARYLIEDNLSLDEAEQLIAALVSNCNDAISQL